MTEVRSGFQKWLKTGAPHGGREDRVEQEGGWKRRGFSRLCSVTPVPEFCDCKFPPKTSSTSPTVTISLPRSSTLHHLPLTVVSGEIKRDAVRKLNSDFELVAQTHDNTKQCCRGPLCCNLYYSQTRAEIGRVLTLTATVPLFAETPFLPPYLPLCLNPSSTIPSPTRPPSRTVMMTMMEDDAALLTSLPVC